MRLASRQRLRIGVPVNSALIRRLRRETAANPAKAGALALCLVVAIWFWAPLVVRWCSPAAAGTQEPEPAVAAESAAGPAVAEPAQTASTGTTPAPAIPWQSVMKAIEMDPRMQPMRKLGERRDPFGPSAAALAAEKASQQKKIRRAPPHELLPADAGLVLNSTLIGAGRRMALIGGEPYWEGDTVPAPRGSENFHLVEVFARQVVLEREGKHYGLEIQTTTHDTGSAGKSPESHPDSTLSEMKPKIPTPRSGRASTTKQNPFAKFNANE